MVVPPFWAMPTTYVYKAQMSMDLSHRMPFANKVSEKYRFDDLGSECGSCPAPAPPSSPTRAPALHSAKQNREKITCTQGPSRVRARVRGTASGRDREVGNDWFDPVYEHLFTGSQLVASSKQQHLKTPVLARPDGPAAPKVAPCRRQRPAPLPVTSRTTRL